MNINLDLREIEILYPNAYRVYRDACEKRDNDTPKSFGEIIASDDNIPFIDFFDEQGWYICVHPEFYKEGINWNLQIFWYADKDTWPKRPKKHISDYLIDGTMLYGDNNEFPVRRDAEEAGYVFAFELMERKITGKKLLPDLLDEVRHGDELNFNKLFRKIDKE